MTAKLKYLQTLRDRWLEPDFQKMVPVIKKSILSNTISRLWDYCGGTDDGKLDLRGCPLHFSVNEHLEDLEISDMDFTYAEMGWLVLQQSRITNCKFSYASMDKWWEKTCRFSNVKFDHTGLYDSIFGIAQSLYEKVDFTKSIMNGSFMMPQFVDCNFSRARLTGTDFGNSTFTRCCFAGPLTNVRFWHHYKIPSDKEKYGDIPKNEMIDVDFSNAEFHGLQFFGDLDLSRTILPADDHLFLVRDYRLAMQQMDVCKNDLGFMDQEKMSLWIRIENESACRQKMWIVSRKETIKLFGDHDGQIFLDFLQPYR